MYNVYVDVTLARVHVHEWYNVDVHVWHQSVNNCPISRPSKILILTNNNATCRQMYELKVLRILSISTRICHAHFVCTESTSWYTTV